MSGEHNWHRSVPAGYEIRSESEEFAKPCDTCGVAGFNHQIFVTTAFNGPPTTLSVGDSHTQMFQ